MAKSVVDPCLVCREHSGDVVIPGGFLIETANVIAFHCPPLPNAREPYLGYLFVTPRRHTPSFAELTHEEAGDVGVAMSRLCAALTSLGAERVYTVTIGHDVPHLHVHLVPRWPETPPEISWRDVDSWTGARRGDADDVAAMASQLRTSLE
jgi:histidine triad (HIT) family protein